MGSKCFVNICNLNNIQNKAEIISIKFLRNTEQHVTVNNYKILTFNNLKNFSLAI